MVKFLESFFQAVSAFFGWRKQADDPETRRLKRIEDIDKALAYWRSERTRLMAMGVIRDEEKHAVDLGVATGNIVRLRRERAALVR